MRLTVVRELKDVHRFFDNMEKSVKSLNPIAIQKAYIFLQHMVREMNEGMLSPDSIALDLEIAHALMDFMDENNEEQVQKT